MGRRRPGPLLLPGFLSGCRSSALDSPPRVLGCARLRGIASLHVGGDARAQLGDLLLQLRHLRRCRGDPGAEVLDLALRGVAVLGRALHLRVAEALVSRLCVACAAGADLACWVPASCGAPHGHNAPRSTEQRVGGRRVAVPGVCVCSVRCVVWWWPPGGPLRLLNLCVSLALQALDEVLDEAADLHEVVLGDADLQLWARRWSNLARDTNAAEMDAQGVGTRGRRYCLETWSRAMDSGEDRRNATGTLSCGGSHALCFCEALRSKGPEIGMLGVTKSALWPESAAEIAPRWLALGPLSRIWGQITSRSAPLWSAQCGGQVRPKNSANSGPKIGRLRALNWSSSAAFRPNLQSTKVNRRRPNFGQSRPKLDR